MIEEGTGYYAVPSSVKVVVLAEGRVLLARNHRGQWELPGGWPTLDDSHAEDVAVREVLEESGISLNYNDLVLVSSDLFRPVHDQQVMLVCYSAYISECAEAICSSEHDAITWFPKDELPENLPPVYNRMISAALY